MKTKVSLPHAQPNLAEFFREAMVFNPLNAKATFLSFLTDIDKRVLCAKTQFAIDTVNILNLFQQRGNEPLFEIHDFEA